MADFSGIGEVSQSLQAMLTAAIFTSGPFPGTIIDLRSPKEIAAPPGDKKILSFWLYRVGRFDELENAPPVLRLDGRLERAPLPLVLHYLMTPIANDELNRHQLLGLAMRVLHDQAQVGPEFLRPDLLGDIDPPIGLHLEQQSFEETGKIWHALHEPYRLSVSYLVQYVALRSDRSSALGGRVLETDARFANIEAAA
jgi:hypothetical protein